MKTRISRRWTECTWWMPFRDKGVECYGLRRCVWVPSWQQVLKLEVVNLDCQFERRLVRPWHLSRGFMCSTVLQAGASDRIKEHISYSKCLVCLLALVMWAGPPLSAMINNSITVIHACRWAKFTGGKRISYKLKKKTYLFMLTHDVSKIPISLKTPSRMSRITSGGMRSERISERDSGLMFPTASLASLTRG